MYFFIKLSKKQTRKMRFSDHLWKDANKVVILKFKKSMPNIVRQSKQELPTAACKSAVWYISEQWYGNSVTLHKNWLIHLFLSLPLKVKYSRTSHSQMWTSCSTLYSILARSVNTCHFSSYPRPSQGPNKREGTGRVFPLHKSVSWRFQLFQQGAA